MSSASAQSVFVAPTARTVIASTEQGMGSEPAQQFVVMNASSVPIIVFGVTTYACENVKQWCGGRRMKLRIEPGQRRTVGTVEPRTTDLAYSYRWNFSYHADSADARMIAALREQGLLASAPDDTEPAPVAMARPVPVVDTSAPPGIDQPLSREPLTDEERRGGVTMRGTDEAPAPASFRFKVHYGSILGSTMMAGAQVQATGPCIDPAASARLERDARITRTPWRPPVVPAAFPRRTIIPRIPGAPPRPELLVRWAVDTSGATVPESVRVLESPEGKASVAVCTSVISGRVDPARDKGGRAVRAWVQMVLQAP